MLVFGGGVLRLHHVGRGWRVQKWDGIHHHDFTFHPSRSRTCEHMSGGNGFGKPTRHNISSIHCSGVICDNCNQHCPFTIEIQQSVCMVGTKMCEGSSQKLMFGGALSLLQPFKGLANRFPESLVTLWDMGSPFCLK
jgi:hypothetical protein